MIQKPTPKQLRANRQNAKKCTGPKTSEGKRKVSHNAVKHGMYTRDLILRRKDSPENAAEFEKLLGELIAQYAPQSAVEQAMVEDVAACLWRRRRAHRFEAAAMSRQLDKARFESEEDAEQFERVNKAFEEVRGKVMEAHAAIEKLKNPPAEEDAAGRAEFEAMVSGLAQRFGRVEQGKALIEGLMSQMGDQIAINTGRMLAIRSSFGELAARQERALSGEVEVWLPPFDELGKLVRYENMLNRQLHRALMELRKIRKEAGEANTAA